MPEGRERKFGEDFLDKWERAEREERPEEALKQVDEALRENPNDAKLWFRRGTLLLDLARWTEALDSFARVESLSPSFPLLNLAKSFVLNKLGRTQEAAEAQRKALADVAAGVDEGLAKAIEKPEGVEAALAALAEDLRKQAEKTAAGEKELPAPAGAPGEEDPATKLARWTAQGYDTTPLREILDKDPDRARTAFFQFEQNVKKVEVLKETLRALDPEGLEAEIARIRGLFRAPYQIWRVEAELATLLEKAEERDRRRRAIVAPSPGGPAPRPRERARPEPLGPGRVNGLVNGTRRPGLTNGLVNGTRRAGVTNGLVNGLRRARTGMTNGLTNGTGFTNGLGSQRFAREVRTGWGRLLLVPLTAILLLSYPFFVAEAPHGIVIDGTFADWRGVDGYVQDSSATNADVDIREYRVSYEAPQLSLYVKTSGVVFGNPSAVDVFDVFIDADGNRTTGYDEGRVGADLRMAVSGWNETIFNVQLQEWTGGADRDNWTAWHGLSFLGSAAAKGPELELQVDLGDYEGFDASKAAISIHAEDQSYSSSRTGLLAGMDYGALRVEQRAAATVLPSGVRGFVILEFTAVGAPVSVTNLTFVLAAGMTEPAGFSAFQLNEAENRTVTLTMDTTGLASGTLLVADLASVVASRPATIVGDPVRAYVGVAPSMKTVDGLFSDWAPADFLDDASNDVADPNVDLRHVASETEGTSSFVYVEVAATALGGSPSPQQYQAIPPEGGGGVPLPPMTPVRKTGEDRIFVYFDGNATDGGIGVRGIVADTCLEVRGRNGRVRSARAFEWTYSMSDGRWEWEETGGSQAVAAGTRLEASVTIPGVDLRGARFVVVAMDWEGATDDTAVHGVRGTRSDASGRTFQDSYEATLPHAADGLVRFRVPGGFGLSWRLPEVKVLGPGSELALGAARGSPFVREGFGGSYRDAYEVLEADVVYEAREGQLKETIVLSSAPELRGGEYLLLETAVAREGDLLVRVAGEETDLGFLVAGDIEYVDGFATTLTLPAPWAEDAGGRRASLRFRLEDDRVGVLVPADWLADAAYPVAIDPSTLYTLHNNGASDDNGENLGYSVAIGDFNGDAYADVLTGAPANNLGGTTHGYAYVFYGPLSADDSVPNVWINGTTPTVQFGYSVAAGKFNGDAYWDALVARRSLTGFGSGNVSLYYGSGTWSGYEATPDVDFTPPASPANFGWWVAAGNVDGASGDDVLIGEPGRDNDGGTPTSDGRVYVYKSPFVAVEGSADYELYPSTNATGNFGRAIATGLIDSDAYADVIVGEPTTAGGGRVHFFKGSTMVSGSGSRYPAATLSAQRTGEDFGGALDAGKLDTDGYEDIVVGAPRNGAGASLGTDGVAYIYLANSDGSGLTTGASPYRTLTNQSNDEQFGTAVLILDYTRDNVPDVLIGAPYGLFGGQTRGNVYWFNDPLVDQTVDETINGAQSNERFGRCLAGGRFSNNPLSAVAIGAYLWDDSAGDNDGRVAVATVPEPALALVGAVAILGLASLQRRRLFRKR